MITFFTNAMQARDFIMLLYPDMLANLTYIPIFEWFLLHVVDVILNLLILMVSCLFEDWIWLLS